MLGKGTGLSNMIELLNPQLSGGFLGTSICHSPATHQSSIGQNGRRDYVFSLAPPQQKQWEHTFSLEW